MYRFTITSAIRLTKSISPKRYRNYVTPLLKRTFKPIYPSIDSILPPAELAHHIGLRWKEYSNPCYTNSILNIWKRGLILDTNVNFDYLSLDSLVSHKVAIRSMLKQVYLKKMKIPLDIIFDFAEELDVQTLPFLQITFPHDRSSTILKYLQRIARYTSSLSIESNINYQMNQTNVSGYGCTGLVAFPGAVGDIGPVGPVGPTGIRGIAGPTNYCYSNGIIILQPNKSTQINIPTMTLESYKKCIAIIEHLNNNEKYSYVLASMFGENWYK